MIKNHKAITLLIGIALIFGLAGFPALVQAAGEVTKIGIFDLQKAINTSKKGQSAKAKLSSKFEKMQKELKSRETELERLQQELERQSSALSLDAKFEKEKSLKRKMRDFQDLYRDYTAEMQKDEVETTQPIVNELIKIAKDVGKEKGFTVILEVQKSGIVYAPGDLDVTDEIIRRLDGGK
ncbi:MAG: OmpH family outer membrane protein [Deltaproteobacteria bacterium]|nr:OmpH family outer membrane protein [Deltaproteobacteria bacterium]